jgi:glycosyltransferase involved in cell wall biosynthesis
MKIIFFSEIKWQYLRTRKQQLIRRFPAAWQILFLEPYAAGRPNGFRLQWDNNVCFVTLPYFKNFPQRWLQMIVSFKIVRLFVIAVAAIWAWVLIRRSGFGKSHTGVADLVMVSNVYAAPLVRWLAKRRPVIYDCNDNHLGFPLTPKWAEKYFESTCARADRIVCASQSLAEIIPTAHQNKIVFIGNGVDSGLFLKNSTPAEALATFRPRPILLYIGAISEWADFEALNKVAARHPDKMLILIGPAVPAVQLQINKLLAFSNVRYLGVVRHDDLPAYLAAADVCLIPLRKNDLTRFLNPNKLYEYFAAGKPVVSMALSPDLIALREHVFLAEEADEFSAQIEPALATIETRAEERRRLAAANDWQEKAKQMTALIGEVCLSR